MTDPHDDLSWLDALEQRIREATARLQELTNENTRLAARISDLEASSRPTRPPPHLDPERQDIRQRVEKLTQNLEDLLDDED